jgi:iron complex outermembrane recepter protein
VKSELFGRALTFNINGFLYKYKNEQYEYYPLGGLANARPIIGNAAKSTLYGIDIDFIARPTPQLTFNGGIEFLHTRFDDFPGALLSMLPTDGGGGLVQFQGSAAGARIPFAQNFVGTLSTTYKREIQGVNVALNATAAYQGNYYLDIDYGYQKPYVMLNSSIIFSDPSDKLSLALTVTNALDKAYMTKVIDASFQSEAAYGAPRQYRATMGLKF